MLIDLQIHSTYSDGYLTPTEVANFLARKGIKIASLTDHNTVSGLDEFRKACIKNKIRPIVGLELYVKLNAKKINLLWFNFDYKNPELHNILRNSQIRRRGKVRKALERLVNYGFKININKILDKYTHYIPINHVVDDIWAVKKNQVKIRKDLKNKTPQENEIIKYCFYNEDIGILRESYVSIEKVLACRNKIGGQLILNHPGKHNLLNKDLLEKLKKIGIDGIETLSPHHSIGAVMYAQYMAYKLDFIETGGSDFHRHEGDGNFLQNSWQYFKIDSKYLRRIKEIIN